MVQTKSFVIAIAAVSGGGKTAVTTQLNKDLPNSKVLFFDAYDFTGPDNIPEWVERGSHYDEWDLAPFIKDIKMLHNEGQDFIVLDYPFAYKHTEVSDYIDLVIFIDTALDLAMGRRIIRDFSNRTQKDILIDIQSYMTQGRSGYLEMLETIKPNADIIIDGTLSITEIVDEIMAYLKNV